jgi:putative ABC transport system permease protein
VNLSNPQESLTHIEAVYNSFFPGNAFEYFFLENEFNRQYQSDVQFGNLFLLFTVLAIFIASVGLFALVSYSATLRIKEIGIRKVLGANVGSLMMLLSREYMLLLLLASIFAIPITIYCGRRWLGSYAFRTDLGFELFLFPLMVLIAVSILTVGYRTFVTARQNPVDSLRTD